jgi:ferredoxin--NADP+ reductase
MLTPDQIAELRRQRYNATIVYLHKSHSDLCILRVRPDFPRPPHRAGQYTVLGLGNWEPRYPGCQEEHLSPEDEPRLGRRSYSISCSILDEKGNLLDVEKTDWLEFYIVLVHETETEKPPLLTPRLFLLREGERLFLGEKIAGHFTLEGVKPTDTVLFLSTGTGEAPHNYMLWELLHNKHSGRIVSACCVRYARDLGYRAIHEAVMGRFSNYAYLPLTTREGVGPAGKVYIQDLITSGELERVAGKRLDPAATHVFLCGNPKMIGLPEKNRETGVVSFPKPTGVVELLVQRGFRLDQPAQKVRGNIHYEEYW